MKIYKIILLDIACNLGLIVLMCFPVYFFGLSPIAILVYSIVFDIKFGYKPLNSIVLWRILPAFVDLYLGYYLNVYLTEWYYNNEFNQKLDGISYLILDYGFYISLGVVFILLLIYQILLLCVRIWTKHSKNIDSLDKTNSF